MKRAFLLFLVAFSCAQVTASQPAKRLGAKELQQLRLPDVRLESVAERKPSPQKAGAYLEVRGIIGDGIRFEVLLPEEWNGRFVMGGGGGFVGSIQNAARSSVQLGYATAGTDTGHTGKSGHTAEWARDNLEAQINFGYLAVHRTAEVARALIRACYGADAEYSYFIGCSRGGGQAMMESQRYPRDFDGIVAGAPAFDWTGFAATMVQIAKVLYPDPKHLDRAILDQAALQRLADSVLQQCDAQDGLADGIVNNPAAVRFDLSKVPGLTEEQRKAIAAIYQGARNTRGPIYPGYPAGAEVVPGQWIAWLTGPVPALLAKDQAPDLTFSFGTQVFKYLVFNNPDWDYSTYDFAGFERDTRLAASFLNATNSDLDAFKARKGKLILWHGWADTALPAEATVDYYKRVLAHDPKAAGYCRLFMVPGCLHCGGGPGASSVDWLAAIVGWVEHGQAPDCLIASKLEKGKVAMTRPVYPYPTLAIYKGSGDPDKAESFGPLNPAK